MFAKKQQYELITSIKGRGEIPLKFAYLGEGAKNWDLIAKQRRSKTKGINSIEAGLLKKKINNFISSFPNCKKLNIIDIGCGNGEPIMPILDVLTKQDIQIRYVPIDISLDMLSLAEKFVKKNYPKVETKSIQLDFEMGNFSDIMFELKENGYSNLLLFLGSTLGNHSDRQRVLTNFRDSMSSDDFFILGVELTNFSKINRILPHYNGKLPEEFLYFIPDYIGINRKNTEYDVSWNDKLNQVEMKTILKKDSKIRIGTEQFILKKEEQILLSRSIKFTEWTITKLLSDIGFRTELLTTTSDRGYLFSMVQPTRYGV
jgi:uncharacterized SAM-dependent methyltransferase